MCAQAGATTVLALPERPPASGELLDAIRRAHAREVVLLPNSAELRHTAAAAAEQARTEGVRVALVPTRAAVQASPRSPSTSRAAASTRTWSP